MESSSGFELRPRGIGEILDLVFRVYRRGFKVFAAIGIVQSLVYFVLGLAYSALTGNITAEGAGTPLDVAVLGAGLVVLIPLIVVAAGWSATAGTASVEALVLGRPLRFGDVAARALSRTPHAIWTLVLAGLLIMTGLVLCCVPGIVLTIVLVFAVPLCWLERVSGPTALTRSFELVLKRGPGGLSLRSNFIRILIIGFIVTCIYYALNLLASAPVFLVILFGSLSGGGMHQTMFGPQFAPLYVTLPLQLAAGLFQGLFAMIPVIPWTLLYYDIRTRDEGLDLEMTVNLLGGTGGFPTGSPPGSPPGTPPPPLSPPA